MASMKAKVDIIGQQSIFSDEDTISAEVIVKRYQDEPFFSELVSGVNIQLVCEGDFEVDGSKLQVVKYYESEPVACKCNYSTRGHVIYSGQLKFPRNSDAIRGYPSSLVYNEVRNKGVKWCVRAAINRRDKDSAYVVERACLYRPTSPLPDLLDLVDIEHSEILDGSNVTLVTTHAAAGLPQLPLTAGISFSIYTEAPKKFTITRLRLLLHEVNEILVNDEFRPLPIRRWLLDDSRWREGIRLEYGVTNLDEWVGDTHVDHATIAPSFETTHFRHRFDLVAEVTVAWQAGKSATATRRLSSISPVIILPRITKVWSAPTPDVARSRQPSAVEKPGHEPLEHFAFDPAEITDTSSEESDENNGDELYSIGTHLSQSVSSNSINSILSAHMKHDAEELNSLPSITTTSY